MEQYIYQIPMQHQLNTTLGYEPGFVKIISIDTVRIFLVFCLNKSIFLRTSAKIRKDIEFFPRISSFEISTRKPLKPATGEETGS